MWLNVEILQLHDIFSWLNIAAGKGYSGIYGFLKDNNHLWSNIQINTYYLYNNLSMSHHYHLHHRHTYLPVQSMTCYAAKITPSLTAAH